MSHVFLIGFMGAGKSTVGAILALRLSLPLIDLDALIEQRTGRSVPGIFSAEGEDAFREIERVALAAASAGPDAVIACGGGVVLHDENRALMRERGTVVYLAVSPEEAVARIGDTSGRPLLAGDSLKMAGSILDARLSLYRATAHHVVDTTGRSADEVAEEIFASVSGPSARVIEVRTGRDYKIHIGTDILDSVGATVAEATGSRRVALVTDANVDVLLGKRVERSLEAVGLSVSRMIVPAGERSKSWQEAERVLNAFAKAGLDRGCAVVALGGGVVGDLAGFCAATFMRGIALVHVPTTLLAQVDSSIGGKTGVDLAAGKNLAGAFWQPTSVLSDTSVLQTLPESEWQNGLVEVVKTAFLQGEAQVARLERDAVRLLARDEYVVIDVVTSCARFKAEVVSADEREAGRRECLNLGHTLGHAIEKVSGYGTVPHGVAVGEGMRFASRLAEQVLDAPAGTGQRVDALLNTLGIPRTKARYDAAELKKAMLADKKNRNAVVRFVLVGMPGECVVRPIEEDVLAQTLGWWLDQR
ncbi:MAG: 3-dehydroquinate synthase [Coriobacteriia bacterium]|nr:3-dehydroquinate synthase [Coriobacteriia bacterium]